MKPTLGMLALATVIASTATLADEAAPQTAATSARAEIPFVNHGGIWDWKADGRDALLIKSRSGHYYRATFFGPCTNLPYANQVGFITDSRDVLDRYQSIQVDHERCQFQTFDEVPKPDKW
jgi:hypothetical protein